MSIMDNVQPAVKKETGKVAAITGIGLILMWIVFGVLHAFMPQKVPFDYTVFLGGAVGGCVAVLNFFRDLQCRKQLQQQMRTQRE